MRSWLYSPAVQFLSLIASLLTLGQFTAMAFKRLSAILRADHEHRRVYSAAALAGLVALAVCVPLAWSADIQVGRMMGTGGILVALYPVLMTAVSAIGCWMLYRNKRWPTEERHVGPVRPAILMLLGLVSVDATKFGVRTPPAWEAYMLIGFPGLVVAIYLLAFVLEGVDRLRVERADPRWREINELRRRARSFS